MVDRGIHSSTLLFPHSIRFPIPSRRWSCRGQWKANPWNKYLDHYIMLICWICGRIGSSRTNTRSGRSKFMRSSSAPSLLRMITKMYSLDYDDIDSRSRYSALVVPNSFIWEGAKTQPGILDPTQPTLNSLKNDQGWSSDTLDIHSEASIL